MSLHAQPTTETLHQLKKQQRNASITSVLIALLTSALLCLALAWLLLPGLTTQEQEITIYRPIVFDEPDLKPNKVKLSLKSKPSPPSAQANRLLLANIAKPLALTPVFDQITEPTLDTGSGNDFGGGYDDGTGTGAEIEPIRRVLSGRCSANDRLARLVQNGGTPECDEAVMNGLRWLKVNQNKDGSWSDRYQVGITGLALLAYLGHCETTQSEEFGLTVLSGLTYLINQSKKNRGKLTTDLQDKHWCYDHAIGTYALAEAYTLCTLAFGENIPELKKTLLTSGQYLINSQHQSGGWDYGYSEDSRRGGDTSITGWHLQALKACKLTRLEFRNIDRTARKALNYFSSKQNSAGAIGYTSTNAIANNRDGTTLAAVGALSYQIWGKNNHLLTRKACRFIDATIRFDWHGPSADLYGHYYAAQAMNNYGGEAWKKYNTLFRDQILYNQNPDGSWKDVGGGKNLQAVAAAFKGNSNYQNTYRTCLAVLMLETYYRYLTTDQQK